MGIRQYCLLKQIWNGSLVAPISNENLMLENICELWKESRYLFIKAWKFILLRDFNVESIEGVMKEFMKVYHLENLLKGPNCSKNPELLVLT